MFCREGGTDTISTSVDQPIEFQNKIFESGVEYSSKGTARSSLSSVLIMDNGIFFGKHPFVQQFMESIFNLWPALPRQLAAWDSDIILDCLSSLEYDLPLQDLSEKLVILFCFLSGERKQTVKTLNIKNMVLGKGKKCTFFIKRPMKTAESGFHQSPIVFTEYPSNSKICIVTKHNHPLFRKYKRRITDQLIISYKKPVH